MRIRSHAAGIRAQHTAVSGGNARHMGAVKAARGDAHTGHARSRAGLHGIAARTERPGVRHRIGETGLTDYLARQEDVRLVYAGIQDRDHLPGASVASIPRIHGVDDRWSIDQGRMVKLVDLNADNVGICQQFIQRLLIDPHCHVRQVPHLLYYPGVEALQLRFERALQVCNAGSTGRGARCRSGGRDAARIEVQSHHDGDLAVPSGTLDEVGSVALVEGAVAIGGRLGHALRPALSTQAEQQNDQQDSQDGTTGRSHGGTSSPFRAKQWRRRRTARRLPSPHGEADKLAYSRAGITATRRMWKFPSDPQDFGTGSIRLALLAYADGVAFARLRMSVRNPAPRHCVETRTPDWWRA